MSIFGLYESTAFAKAIAKSNGIRIKQTRDLVVPSIVSRDTIEIGPESLYGHEEYMEELHSELSKLFPSLSHFQDLTLKPGTVGHTTQQILYQHRAEWEKHGEYAGRDRILRDRYMRHIREQGGITELCEKVSEMSPEIAALLYADCEKRGDWQGGISGECPPHLRAKVDAIKPLIDELYGVKTKEELENLIRRIANAEPVQDEPAGNQQDSPQGDAQEGEKGSQSGGGEGGTEGDPGADGEGAEGDDGEGQSDGQGSADGEAEGGSSNQEPADGEQGEGAEGAPGGGDAEGNPGSEQSAGQDAPIDDAPKKTKGNYDEPDDSEFVGAESNEDGGVGKSLDKMSLVRNAQQFKRRQQSTDAPYVPSNRFDVQDLTRGCSEGRPSTRQHIETQIGDSSISKSVRKYLITEKQTGYTYGLKKGRLCGRQVSRIYTGEPQPRIFKERNSSRITTDIAVFILGDCSGSMRGMKYTTSAACQILLSETLRDLQVAHMCTQFTTGSNSLVHYITKHFDEPNVSRDTLLKRYVSCDITMCANGDGESITWAATLLAKRPEKRKLLVVLSDGAPAFSYGNDHQYLIDVVAEIEKSRIMDIVGIGILTNAVERYYKDHRVVHKVQDLERVIFELLKDTLKGGAR